MFDSAKRLAESRLAEELSSPPFPGAVFDRNRHRWVKGTPDAGAQSRAKVDNQTRDIAQSADRAATSARDSAAAEHNFAKTPERPQPKHVRAARTFGDVARRRRVIHAVKNEAELATAIGGFNLPDSEPADVVHMPGADGKTPADHKTVKQMLQRRAAAVKTLKTGKAHTVGMQGTIVKGGPATPEHLEFANKVLAEPAHFFEVKTLLTSSTDAVRMNAKALARKERWMDKYHVAFSVVAIDDRKGKKRWSDNRVYVAPHELGGTTRLANMKPVEMGDVLKKVSESRLSEATNRKEGEEWETNGRKYRRQNGKTVRIGKGGDEKPADKRPNAEPPPTSPEPAPVEPVKPSGPIDWKHKDADHPIAKAVAANPHAQRFAKLAQEHVALQRAAADVQAEKDEHYRQMIAEGADVPTKGAAARNWQAAHARSLELKEQIAASAAKFRAAVFGALATDNGVEIKAETTVRRSWWNPLGTNIASKEEMLAKNDKWKDSRKESAALNDAALEYAKGLVASVFESRGTPIDVEVGYSRSGRAFLQPVGPTVAGVKLLNAKPVIGLGQKGNAAEAEDSIIHEFGHLLEETNPDVKRRANEFLAYRVGDEKPTDMGTVEGGDMMKGEKGRKDAFDRVFDPVSAYYVGKTYDQNSTEIVSMGLEKLHRDPAGFFAKDPEYAGFILSLMRKAPE